MLRLRGDGQHRNESPRGEALVELPRLIAACGAVLMAVALFAFLRLTDLGKAIRALAEIAKVLRLGEEPRSPSTARH